MTRLVHRVARAALAPTILLAVAVALTLPGWRGHYSWATDSVFYEAQTLELRGENAASARAQAIAIYARSQPTTRQLRVFRDQKWVARTAPNYRRRWLVPALAAAVYPVFGVKSLLYVSLAGLLAAALLMYVLARMRFGRVASFSGVAAVLTLSELPQWSRFPLTDSWGLALLTAALISGTIVARRGARWLPLWIAVMLALSITRDATAIALAGALGCLVVMRRRQDVWLVLSGAAVAALAPLKFGGSFKSTLAYDLAGSYPPAHPSWGYDLTKYWPALHGMISTDFGTYVATPQGRSIAVIFAAGCVSVATLGHWSRLKRERVLLGAVGLGFVALTTILDFAMGGGSPVLPIGVLLIGALSALVILWQPDPFFALQAGAALGALGYLALMPGFTNFRYEIVLLAAGAVGTAAWVDRLMAGVRSLEREPNRQPVPAAADVS